METRSEESGARAHPEPALEFVHGAQQTPRRNVPLRQAIERFDRDQIGETEEPLAPARPGMHQPEPCPVIELLARRAGHAPNFAARESLIQIASLSKVLVMPI